MSHIPKLILLAILILLSMAAAFFTWRTHENLEGFDGDEAHKILADGGTDYDKRIYVMKLFDVLLKRKASSDELKEYSGMKSDLDILSAVTTKFMASTAPAPAPAPASTHTPHKEGMVDAEDDGEGEAHATSYEDPQQDALPPPLPSQSPLPPPPHPTPATTLIPSRQMSVPKDGMVCLNKQEFQRNIQDIMDQLASFKETLAHP